MRYQQIPSSLFIKNRQNFAAKMDPNSIAILTSNDVMPNNADDVMGFTQNNDLFYLSGVDQEESILVLYPDAALPENREILFVKETSDLIKIWEGEKLTQEQAYTVSGIKNVKWLQDFELTIQYMAFEADAFYLGHNEHKKTLTSEINTRQDRMISWCKEKYPLHNYKRAAKITRELRQIKSKEEINLMQKAANISVGSFKRVLKTVKPGLFEYELEAELTYELLKKGAKRNAFMPIVASGKNACALHYNTNDSICKDGEMVLMDFGVCYANYNSDTTRCFPVNGKFTKRQKEVYKAVLHCLKEGSKLLKPGIVSADYEKQMVNLVEEQLVKLGLLTKEKIKNQDPKKPLYKRYYMHGSAHHIGLDVHDVGLYTRPFEVGMVLTCEPGIYIAEEGIGCRLENDYLITKNGVKNLTEAMPIEIEEIESLMTK
ncbi:aminopeptidase P N-terminal domain-containing protein [uncultured Lutibacter sp.]|uniref:aminopeptidase P N-terminal domain-containing protein n=1 Tax=uncultured Lutibacter sp. TaxID=437739 RepID=UPI002631116C|nr:aminopeptidase P N-terminal domain-containing protein [uncultured Lutibacter sp.]